MTIDKKTETKSGVTELREEDVEEVQGGWKVTVDNISIGNFKAPQKTEADTSR